MSIGFALKYIGAPLACVLVLILLYTTGYNNGVRAVEDEREADRQEQALVVARLNGQIAEKEKAHVAETIKIKGDLAERERAYAADLARLGSQYAVSLRDSEQRAARYLASADAGPDQCRSLAGYTAQLDGSLVEGRSVVEELRSTLELRDAQLRLVGSQLLSDRQLYEDYGTSNH
jgi:tellurite resistance protein